MKWHLQKIKVSDLKEYPQNPMQHNEKDLGDLEVSINKFGVADPIRINTDFMIIGGHGTKKVLEKNGIKEVDCYLPERKLTKAEFKELNVRLNKNRSQSWDFDLLANNFELNELIDFGFDNYQLTGVADKLNELEEWNKNTDSEFRCGDKDFKIHIYFESAKHREIWVNKNNLKVDNKESGVWIVKL